MQEEEDDEVFFGPMTSREKHVHAAYTIGWWWRKRQEQLQNVNAVQKLQSAIRRYRAVGCYRAAVGCYRSNNTTTNTNSTTNSTTTTTAILKMRMEKLLAYQAQTRQRRQELVSFLRQNSIDREEEKKTENKENEKEAAVVVLPTIAPIIAPIIEQKPQEEEKVVVVIAEEDITTIIATTPTLASTSQQPIPKKGVLKASKVVLTPSSSLTTSIGLKRPGRSVFSLAAPTSKKPTSSRVTSVPNTTPTRLLQAAKNCLANKKVMKPTALDLAPATKKRGALTDISNKPLIKWDRNDNVAHPTLPKTPHKK